MTSLARQLERLAIPGQPSLKQLVSKKRASLLFDRKEAADIDIDTFYSLGCNGLEELISIDPTFAQFEDTLFQESCKEFERSVQTPDVLVELDKNLSVFLRRVSPYFLLKPAQKCLEWLIQAYRVNSYNVNDVMECILPFYETKLFARVVQLLPLKSSSSEWHWLRPLQRAGSPLSRLALVQHCISVPAFLVFICEMVSKSIAANKHSPPGSLRSVLALYCTTVVLVLNSELGTSEEIIGRLLPYVLKGLKSRVVDYRAASYMIVGQLASKTALEERVATSLIETATKHLVSELGDEGVSCAAVICYTQTITRLSSKTLRNMLRMPSLTQTLSSLSSSHNISSLLRLLLSALISAHFEKCGIHGNNTATLETVLTLLDEIPLEEEVVLTLIRELLGHYVSHCTKSEEEVKEEEGEMEREEEGNMELNSSVTVLAQSLDAKYPKLMDKALKTALVAVASGAERNETEIKKEEEEEDDDDDDGEEDRRRERAKWIYEFVSSTLPGSRHQFVRKGRRSGGSEETLVLSIHHPESSVREAAVKQLGRALKHKKGSSYYDNEFAQSCLLSRLQDEDPSVVAAVLELGVKILTHHVPPLSVLPPLLSILTRHNLPQLSLPWQQVVISTLSLLTSKCFYENIPEQFDDVVITSLPLLFVHRRGNKLAEGVAGVLFEVNHDLVKGLTQLREDESWRLGCSHDSERDSGLLAAANSSLILHLGTQLAELEHSTRHTLVTKLLCKATSSPPDTPAHFVYLGIVGVAMATDSTHSSYWLRPVLTLLQYVRDGLTDIIMLPPPNLSSPTATLTDTLRPLVRKRVQTSSAHSMLLLWLLDTLVTQLPIVEVSTEMWLSVPEVCDDTTSDQQCYHKALLTLFDIITSSCMEWSPDTAKNLLQGLLKIHLSNQGYLLRFLAMMWTAPVSTPYQPNPHSIPEQSESNTSPEQHGTISAMTQANSLAVFSSFIKCLLPESQFALVDSICPVVPSLLIPLTSPYQPIRHHAITCLSLLHHTHSLLPSPQRDSAYSTTPMFYLLDTLVESELALSSDPSALPHILGQMFHVEGKKGTAKRTHGKHQTKKKLEQRVRVTVLDSILNGIQTHIVVTSPPPHIQSSLLRILNEVDNVLKVSATQPLLRQLLDKCSSHTSSPLSDVLSPHEATSLQLCMACITPSVAAGFLETFLESSDTHQSFQLLLKALTLHSPTSSSYPSPLEMALQQVTPSFFTSLSADSLKLNLLNSLLSILVTTQRSEVAVMVKHCFMKLELSAELVIELYSGYITQLVQPPATPGRKRQKHVKDVAPSTNLSNEQGLPHGWRAITILLELLQDSNSNTVTDYHQLTPHYFSLLSRCLQADDHERLQLEYTQQLLLSALLSICSQLTIQGIEEARALIPETVFNMELIVQCVRLSSNPLTHHHALLLLSSAASLYPGRVLHNIMPVFTFMGSSLLRNDDQYSFQVITQTIDSVIPPLIQSGSLALTNLTTSHHLRSTPSHRKPHPQQQGVVTTVDDIITEILQVFIDAVPHVPDHRRLPLLSHLLQKVGPTNYLSTALGLLVAKHVQQLGVKEQTPKEAVLSLSFSVSLAHVFPVEQQLMAVSQLLAYIISLPIEKPSSVSALRQLPAAVSRKFNIATHTQKQLLQFKYSCMSLISTLLAKRRLSEQLLSGDKKSIEEIIHSILKTTLDYETVLSKHTILKSDNKQTKQDSAHNNKLSLTLVNKISDVIGHVTALLSPVSLVAMVIHLLCVSGEEVKVKALKLVAKKLEEGQKYFGSNQDECIVELLSAVVGVAKSDSSHLLTRHSAVYCVKLIARRLTHKHHHLHLTQALQEMLTLLKAPNISSEVIGSVLLTVAEISSSLGPQLIPLLPLTLPPVLEYLGEDEGEREGGGSACVMVKTATVTTLRVIVQTLPKFLSSFAVTIITELCRIEQRVVGREDKERVQLQTEASLTREKVAMLIPPRTLVPAYTNVYPLLCPLGKGCLLALLDMLRLTVSSLKQEDTHNLTPQLRDLFLLCLDYRAQHKQLSMEDLDEVEDRCVQAFTHLVVHLSESLFRPMFLKMLDWATSRGAEEERLIAFYHMANGVAGKLKGLFLLFAGHIVKNAATLLQKSNTELQECSLFQDDSLAAEKTSCLLSHLLSCLHKCFLHSQASSSSFLTRERFNTLMQPLVQQISNVIGGEKAFQQRVDVYLCPCVAQLAMAAGKEDMWKPLNHQILLKTRHKASQVRYASVVILKEMYSKLGNAFMSLLPETVPFIAELLEDESEEVEQETQALISIIETQLGEPIQQYLQ